MFFQKPPLTEFVCTTLNELKFFTYFDGAIITRTSPVQPRKSFYHYISITCIMSNTQLKTLKQFGLNHETHLVASPRVSKIPH